MRSLSRLGLLLALALTAGCPDDSTSGGTGAADGAGDSGGAPDGAQDATATPDAAGDAAAGGDASTDGGGGDAAAGGDASTDAHQADALADAGGADAAADAQPDVADAEATGPACCVTAGDCEPGERCVSGAAGQGFCLPSQPPPFGCYTDGDCFGPPNRCIDGSLPACAPGVTPKPGVCEFIDPPNDACCTSDDDCLATGFALCAQGHCAPALLVGTCFDTSHCEPGQICVQALVEACVDGTEPHTPGLCVPDDQVPVCCGASWPCPEGLTCGLAPGATSDGTCKEAPAGGGCWSDADCPEATSCVGAFVCPCVSSCPLEDTMGVCQSGPPDCCTTDGDCGTGQRCVGDGSGTGVCKPLPGWGSCWDGNDCAPTQTCEGGHVCPCDADCDQADALGACVGGDSGCCTGAGVCPAGSQCLPFSGIGWSTCVQVPEPGRCYTANDCPAGHTCQGAGVCPCNADCDMSYEGPGVCVPPAGCTPLQTSWVQEVCDAASLVIWDGAQCVATCPGCCGCEPFCDRTFPSTEACAAACGCTVWDGSCDDAIPPSPWWALTADGCEEITTCVCEGCAGTFPTQASCEACL